MTEPNPNPYNIDLLDEVIADIEANPESWNQHTWAEKTSWCRTAYCVAGHAVVRSLDGARGDKLLWRVSEPLLSLGGVAEAVIGERECRGVMFNGEHRTIYSVARELLGLTDREADKLFNGGNSLATIKRYRNMLASGETIDTDAWWMGR